jgi:site-specific recombinase XerD
MANAQNFTVSFIIRTARMIEGQAPIYARISVDGKRTEFSIKRFIFPELWNKEAGKAKPKSKEAPQINAYLDKIRKRLWECYSESLLNNKVITGPYLKNLYFGIDEEAQKTNVDLFEYHNITEKLKLNKATFAHYKTTQKYFNEFLRKKKKSEIIPLKTIDYKTLVEFELFLRKKNGLNGAGNMHTNTTMKHFCRIRKMLNLAERLDWIQTNPFKNYKISYERKEREYLNEEQLEKLENKEFSIPIIQLVKDLFIFSCYTGIAYIDIQNLTEDNLVKGIDGQNWLSFQRHKTKSAVKLPLLRTAEKIIKKYTTHPALEGTSWLFPRISNQRTNSYLKEIADLSGIRFNLTFHMARHTFATTVTLSNGVPIETVSKILGHTSLKTTQIYAKVIENKVADDMQKLRTKLEKTVKSNARKSN